MYYLKGILKQSSNSDEITRDRAARAAHMSFYTITAIYQPMKVTHTCQFLYKKFVKRKCLILRNSLFVRANYCHHIQGASPKSGQIEQFLIVQPQRASLMCTICIEGPPRQFDALLARLHQQSMLIFATIALGHPKSAFEPFQRLQGSSRCVLSSDSSSLAYWNLRWTVLKPYILPQRHKQWISGIQRTELFPLLSARREGLR